MRWRRRLATLAQRTGSTAPVPYTISTAVPRVDATATTSGPRPKRHHSPPAIAIRKIRVANARLSLSSRKYDMFVQVQPMQDEWKEEPSPCKGQKMEAMAKQSCGAKQRFETILDGWSSRLPGRVLHRASTRVPASGIDPRQKGAPWLKPFLVQSVWAASRRILATLTHSSCG